MSVKYLLPETEVILQNGVIKKAKQLEEDDILLGKNGESVYINEKIIEKQNIYNVIPVFADSFQVGENHNLFSISSLEISNNLIQDLNDCRYTLRKTVASFPFNKIKMDPYFIGLYVGNNYSLTFKKENKEIMMFLKIFIKRFNFDFEDTNDEIIIKDIRIINLLDIYNINEESISYNFLYNSIKIRYKLLAGIIDIKGEYDKDKYCYIILINEEQKNDILYLINSLGFFTTTHHMYEDKYKIHIYGNDLSEIPLLTDKKINFDCIFKCYFKVAKKLDKKECIKLKIDGDSVVLKDFTVI